MKSPWDLLCPDGLRVSPRGLRSAVGCKSLLLLDGRGSPGRSLFRRLPLHLESHLLSSRCIHPAARIHCGMHHDLHWLFPGESWLSVWSVFTAVLPGGSVSVGVPWCCVSSCGLMRWTVSRSRLQPQFDQRSLSGVPQKGRFEQFFFLFRRRSADGISPVGRLTAEAGGRSS